MSTAASAQSAATALAARMTSAAAAGIESAGLNFHAGESKADLRCCGCQSVLYRPTTLLCGSTYCLPCAAKLPADRSVTLLGFGKVLNTCLDGISEACAPDAYAAAKLRHESNQLFKRRDHRAALEVRRRCAGRTTLYLALSLSHTLIPPSSRLPHRATAPRSGCLRTTPSSGPTARRRGWRSATTTGRWPTPRAPLAWPAQACRRCC